MTSASDENDDISIVFQSDRAKDLSAPLYSYNEKAEEVRIKIIIILLPLPFPCDTFLLNSVYSDPTISYHRIIILDRPAIGPPPLNAVHNVLFIAHPQFHRQLMLHRYDLATYVRSLRRGGGTR